MSLRERTLVVVGEGDVGGDADVPCSIWSATATPRGIVLLGHGLGVDRYDSTVRRPMEILAQDHSAVVVVPEIPLHGGRDEVPNDSTGLVERWQRFWITGGAETIRGEFQRVVRSCERRFGTLPIVYFGLSLGTQYGVAFVAQTPSVRSAVLGLFGSYPLPRTPLMNRYAPAVRCPVYFIQKLDDEIHAAESTTHLFSTLGALDKVLDSTSGTHRETSIDSLRNACAFLARHGGFGAE